MEILLHECSGCKQTYGTKAEPGAHECPLCGHVDQLLAESEPGQCAIPDCPHLPDCTHMGLDETGSVWSVSLCSCHFRLAVATQGMSMEEAQAWARVHPPETLGCS